jgi:hypothetical protein
MAQGGVTDCSSLIDAPAGKHGFTRIEGQHFVNDAGFTLETDAPHVIARAFVSGRKMGVVVWNASDKNPASFTVTPDNKWKLSEIAAPEGEPLEGELPAQSIRLLIYKR